MRLTVRLRLKIALEISVRLVFGEQLALGAQIANADHHAIVLPLAPGRQRLASGARPENA